MIKLMNRITCKMANVDDSIIVGMEELSDEIDGRVYPYTRLHLVDPKQKHDYYLEVVESANKINREIEEAKKNAKSTKT